jgi:UDP-N-acetyl-D-mannosaminuronic acid transferase (WecB/TagA/CpsF family)
MALPGVNPTYQYLDNNIAADGTILGQTTASKVGFYGKTPVIQPTSASQAAAASTASTSTNPFGFTTSTQANAVVTLVNQLRSELVTLGLIKGS